MYRSKNFDRFIVMCSTVLLALAGPVLAGAPAPSPTGGGPHPEHLIAHIGDVEFENGQVVKDFKVSYVTHGTLNKKQDNVVVALQHFFGDHHSYDLYIGPGKALDTDKYFIVASDFIASASLRRDMTTGPTNSGLKMEFPPITPRDWINVEYRLTRPDLAIGHFRYAECLHKKGDLDAAREQLVQAEALFRDMGMEWWTEQAEGLPWRIDRGDPFRWFAPYVDGPPTATSSILSTPGTKARCSTASSPSATPG